MSLCCSYSQSLKLFMDIRGHGGSDCYFEGVHHATPHHGNTIAPSLNGRILPFLMSQLDRRVNYKKCRFLFHRYGCVKIHCVLV